MDVLGTARAGDSSGPPSFESIVARSLWPARAYCGCIAAVTLGLAVVGLSVRQFSVASAPGFVEASLGRSAEAFICFACVQAGFVVWLMWWLFCRQPRHAGYGATRRALDAALARSVGWFALGELAVAAGFSLYLMGGSLALWLVFAVPCSAAWFVGLPTLGRWVRASGRID